VLEGTKFAKAFGDQRGSDGRDLLGGDIRSLDSHGCGRRAISIAAVAEQVECSQRVAKLLQVRNVARDRQFERLCRVGLIH
jgi:hypothetical protein